MRKLGTRTLALDYLLESAKKKPGNRNHLVGPHGYWEIVFVRQEPIRYATYDDHGEVDWSKTITPIESKERPR